MGLYTPTGLGAGGSSSFRSAKRASASIALLSAFSHPAPQAILLRSMIAFGALCSAHEVFSGVGVADGLAGWLPQHARQGSAKDERRHSLPLAVARQSGQLA